MSIAKTAAPSPSEPTYSVRPSALTCAEVRTPPSAESSTRAVRSISRVRVFITATAPFIESTM